LPDWKQFDIYYNIVICNRKLSGTMKCAQE